MQTLYYHGNILTMDHHPCAEAVLVENGRIVAVDTLSAFDSCKARRVDLEGYTLMPSFLDAHSHLSAVANGSLQASLEEAASFGDLQQTLLHFIQTKAPKPGDWILAQGYDHNQLAEGRHPSLALLDAIAPDNPMVLQHKSGHVGVFNTRGLERLGVTADTQPPAGGVIEKIDGNLTGYMEENAFISYLQRVPMPDTQTLLDAYQDAQKLYASYGITTVQEGMLPQQLAPFYQALVQRNLLWLDVVAYADANAYDTLAQTFSAHIGQYHRHFRLGGQKIFLDGSPQGRTAWITQPYQDSTDCGYPTLADAQVLAAAESAATKGVQLLAHCNGDAAAQQYLDCIQAVPAIASHRPVMIHAQFLRRDQLPALKALGILPSFFVAHVYHWGDVHIKNLGERAQYISPAGSALRLDIPFTFHQDTPVLPPDMLETIWCAVVRQTRQGVSLDAQERIPVLAALEAVTCNVAYQYREEQSKGSLTAGKQANMVLLEQNPLTVQPDALRSIRVLKTYREGDCIYQQ